MEISGLEMLAVMGSWVICVVLLRITYCVSLDFLSAGILQQRTVYTHKPTILAEKSLPSELVMTIDAPSGI